MTATAHWHQWGHEYGTDPNTGERVRGPYQNNLIVGNRADLLGALKLNMQGLPQHLFHYYWQGEQMEDLKRQLKPGEVMIVIDFAKNITFGRQHEVQSGFFHRRSATLHPVILYYRCPNSDHCDKLVLDEFMCISPDLVHDAHAVHTYVKQAIAHLKAQGTPIEKLYIFSDNCGVQYKSKLPFELLSEYGIPAEHHYFGAGHGKSAADGAVGRLKKLIEDAIRSCRANIQNALDLALWCQKHYNSKTTVSTARGSETCQHYQKEFEYVANIDRTFVGKAKTVQGTMQLHSVKTTKSKDRILCRSSSCFCRFKLKDNVTFKILRLAIAAM